MSEQPFFSVIIPTFNREETIGTTIESVLDQNFKQFEVLVMDDGSNDNTQEVIMKIDDPRVNYHKLQASGGPAGPRNKGIENAKSEWICFLDSDDSWHENKLTEVFAVIENDPEVEFIFHSLEIKDEHGREMHSEIPLNPVTKPVYKSLYLNYYNKTIPTSAVTVKKSTIQKSGGFNEEKRYVSMEDFDLWIRISKISDNFIKLNKNLGKYTVSEDSITNYSLERCENLKKIVLENFDETQFSAKEKLHIHTYLEYNRSRALQKNGDLENSSQGYKNVIKKMVLKGYTAFALIFYIQIKFKKLFNF